MDSVCDIRTKLVCPLIKTKVFRSANQKIKFSLSLSLIQRSLQSKCERVYGEHFIMQLKYCTGIHKNSKNCLEKRFQRRIRPVNLLTDLVGSVVLIGSLPLNQSRVGGGDPTAPQVNRMGCPSGTVVCG